MSMSTLMKLTLAADEGRSGGIAELFRTHAWIDVNRPVALCSDPTGLTDEHGLTPLHRAAWRGYAETVAVLLRHGARHGVRTSTGRTAEDLATDEAVKRVLREHRELLEKPICSPEAGRMRVLATRLATAVECKLAETTVKELRAGACCTLPTITESEDVPRMNSLPVFDLPAIHRAAYFFDRAVMSAMLAHGGPGVLKAEDGKGNTPLHWLAASYAGWNRAKVAAAIHFMIRAGADVNARNDAGKTPCDLMHLDEPNDLLDVRTACLMANLGALTVNLTAVLAYAASELTRSGLAAAAELLVKHGADPEVLLAYRLVGEPRSLPCNVTRCRVKRVAFVFAAEEHVQIATQSFFDGGAAPRYFTRAEMLRSVVPPPSINYTEHCALVAKLKVKWPWSLAAHGTFPKPARASVEAVMRCALRLSITGLHLPPELWLHVLGFRSLVRWPIAS